MNNKGFSLIELIISLALISIVISTIAGAIVDCYTTVLEEHQQIIEEQIEQRKMIEEILNNEK